MLFHSYNGLVSEEGLKRAMEEGKSNVNTVKEELELRKSVEKAQAELIEFVCQQIGISCLHPNMNPASWPPPTGQVPFVPLKRPMRMDLDEITETDGSTVLNYERCTNLFQIHKCKFAYCLKEIKKKQAAAETNVITRDDKHFVCRFNFPQTMYGFQVKTEKGQHGDFITESNFGGLTHVEGAEIDQPPQEPGEEPRSRASIGRRDLQFARNHPYVDSHVKEIALGWCGNTDTQLIKSEAQCRRYLAKYLNKEEGASHSQKKLMKATGSKLNENSSIRSGIQRLMIQSTTREVCRQEAVIMTNKKGEFMVFSMPSRMVCIGETRRLNLDVTDPNARAFNDSGWQFKYFNRDDDNNFLEAVARYEKDPEVWKTKAKKKLPNYKNVKHPREVNLHDFCSFFTKQWDFVREEHFPVFTPFLREVSPNNKDLYERFCKGRLLQFKAGAKPENLLEGGFKTYAECLEDFVKNGADCPTLVKDEFKEAQMKKAKEEEDPPEDNYDLLETPDYEDLFPDVEGKVVF